MTATAFRAIRTALQLSQEGLAEWLGCDARSVRRYECGRKAIPGPVQGLMRAFRAGYRPAAD